MDKKEILRKLTMARASLLLNAPFFGTLLMNLKFSLASCGTACTDMKRIIWDPEFVGKLSLEEIEFVMQHEVLHCTLQHPLRGRGKHAHFFNIAADIVVNSNILQARGLHSFTVDGEPAMHLTPEGKDGYLYTVEQVYDMLMKKHQKQIDDLDKLCEELEAEYGVSLDKHEIWKSIPEASALTEEWKEELRKAVKSFGKKSGSPPMVRELLENMEYEPRLRWKEILHNFIQVTNMRHDFTFSPADRRFSASDFILPAFQELEGETVNNLWFLVDTSGSINTQMLSEVIEEIRAACNQFEYLQGKLSFFDTKVSEPVSFDSETKLGNVEPVGGGGTSFHCIFEYMREHMLEKLPTAIVILTDGYAKYPKEEAALGVPVLWILTEEENETPAPWGTTVFME